MKYYIVDNTLGSNAKYFNSLNEVITHLEGSVKRKTGLSRIDYMQNLVDLGHPHDDNQGVSFIAAMSEIFDIGTLNDGRHVKGDIVSATHYSKYRTEMGD
jgi:hypothetical protein